MSSFTLLPAIKVESLTQIQIAGAAMFVIGVLVFRHLTTTIKLLPTAAKVIAATQLSHCHFHSLPVLLSSLADRQGLPLVAQIVGWLTLVGSVTVPFLQWFTPISDYRWRLLTIFLAFAPTFIILTISYEGLFTFASFPFSLSGCTSSVSSLYKLTWTVLPSPTRRKKRNKNKNKNKNKTR